MTRICVVAAFVALANLGPEAGAQTNERPTHIPTPQVPNSPYGTRWAKPSDQTGGQIYNDPRLRDPNSPSKAHRSRSCPAPTLYDPSSGACR